MTERASQETLSGEQMEQLRYAAAEVCGALMEMLAEDVPRLIREVEVLRRRVEEDQRALEIAAEKMLAAEARADQLAAALTPLIDDVLALLDQHTSPEVHKETRLRVIERCEALAGVEKAPEPEPDPPEVEDRETVW